MRRSVLALFVFPMVGLAEAMMPALFHPEAGRPLMTHYRPVDYRGHPQAHALAIGEDGFLYVGNQQGLLQFDGVRWGHVPAPMPMVTAVVQGADGWLWVGGENEIGYFDRSAAGELAYQSLSDQIPEEWQPLGRMRGIELTGSGLILVCSSGAFSWDGESFTHLQEIGGNARLNRLGERVFVTRRGLGLYEWVEDRLLLLSDHPAMVEAINVLPAPAPDGRLLLLTGKGGSFALDERTGELEPIETAADRVLAETVLDEVFLLPDGTRVISTYGRGVVLLSADLQRIRLLDRTVGLADDVVFDFQLDAEGGLWVALNSGLTRVDISGAASVWDARNGPPSGTVDAWGRLGGRLYVGCFDGLYRMREADPASGASAAFEHLDLGVTSIFGIEDWWGQHLILATGGLYRLRGAELELALPTPALRPFKMLRCTQSEQTVHIIGTGGHVIAELNDGQWTMAVQDSGPADVRGLVQDADGDLWAASYTSGIWHLPARHHRERETGHWVQYHHSNGLAEDYLWTAVFALPSGPSFFTNMGSYRFDKAAGRFVPEDRFPLPPGTNGASLYSLIHTPDPERVWASIQSTSEIGSLRAFGHFSGAGWQTADSGLLDAVGFAGVAEVFFDESGSAPALWGRGYGDMFRIDLQGYGQSSGGWASSVRRVQAAGEWHPAPAGDVPLEFGFSREPLVFEVASPRYSAAGQQQFQARLVGFNNNWSAPAPSPLFSYTNIEGGPYRFQVRAIDPAGHVSEIAEITFRVFPPWYRTRAAYAASLLMALLLIAGGFMWRIAALRREQTRLQLLVDERTVDLRRAMDMAERANAAKSRFLANMSHELRTPLNSIIGYAELLRTRELAPDRARDGLGIIHHSGEHLLQMINEVLDVAKIEAGRMEFKAEDFSLTHLLQQVAATAEVRALRKSLQFRMESGVGLPDGVRGDGRKLRQVLDNLLSNAIKFTRRGEVSLNIHYSNSRLYAEVADTGQGIPLAEQAHLFQRFRQADGVSSSEGGTGLGLSLVRDFLELMGGSISLKSAPGTGTTMRFDLPLEVTQAAPTAVGPIEQVVGYSGDRRSILIVDDVEANRRLLTDLLQPLGFNIEETDSIGGLMESLTACAFDLVLTDIRLPDGRASERLAEIRAVRTPCPPLLALSASVLELNGSQGEAVAGFDGFLPKPFQTDDLLAKLHELMELEWIITVKETPATTAQLAQSAHFQDDTAADNNSAKLSKSDVHQLLELARMGDVHGLRQCLESLDARLPAVQSLRRELQPLLQQYRISDIRRFLESWNS